MTSGIAIDRLTIEACATSADEVAASFAAGAGRVELCRSLEVGGLTPAMDDLVAALRDAPGPVHVLVRPRGGGFRLGPAALAAVLDEVRTFALSGAAGLVVGVLDRSGRVDEPAMAEVVHAADGMPVTFHRAYDEVEEPVRSVESLLRTGVARVLTSGGRRTAWEGRDVLREVVAEAGSALAVIGAGGIRGDHVVDLLDATGLGEVHARASAIPGIVAALDSRRGF